MSNYLKLRNPWTWIIAAAALTLAVLAIALWPDPPVAQANPTGGAGTNNIVATFVDGSSNTQTSNTVQKIWRLPDGADGEVLSITVLHPPSQINVSDNVPVTVAEHVINNGPGAADFNVIFNAAAPNGCNIVGPTQQIIGPLSLSVGPPSTLVSSTFIIHCSEPSLHTFGFDNEIVVLTPGVNDPVSNNIGSTSLTVAALAQADLAATSWEFDLGAAAAPLGLAGLELQVGEPFLFPTTKVVHNFGDTLNTPPQFTGPVDANVWKTMVIPAGIEGSVHINADEAPADIVIERPGQHDELLPGQPAGTVVAVEGPAELSVHFMVLGLEVSVDRTLGEEFEIHCLDPGFHNLHFVNEIMAKDPHIQDPNPANNTATRNLEVLCLNEFLGYAIKKVDPKFEKVDVTLTDQFVSGTFRIEKPDRLYTPADKEILPDQADAAQVAGLSVHLMRYKVKPAKDASGQKVKKVKVRNILMTNQFGTFLVEAKGPYHILVPTAKALANDHPPGQPTGNVDHYLCYKIKHATVDINVSVGDQFGVKDLEVKNAKTLCNPVEMAHAGIVTPVQSPEKHLMCFEVKKGNKQDIGLNTNNHFGAHSLVVHKPKELCVPSTKDVAEAHPPEPIVDGCTTKVQAMLLRYTGPGISDDGDNNTTVAVTVVSKKGQTVEYILPALLSGTDLSKVAQNDFTIDATAAGETELGSKTSIFIDGVEEVIHTSCSTPFEADTPAPLDDPKGDPSPNWFVVEFTQK